jgi:large subunit ribosomal protein L15
MGSGMGKTSTRGHKGQRSRSGSHMMRGFEGGQMPLHRRIPKRGFTNPTRKDYVVVNLGDIQKAIDAKKLDAAAVIDGPALIACGLLRRSHDGVRLLAKGDFNAKKLKFVVAGASAAAVAAVEKAGGTVESLASTARAEAAT